MSGIVYRVGAKGEFRLVSCLSSIILSPLNGYVKMSPYETGDICIESERIATSGGDFLLREGGPRVWQRPPPSQPKFSACPTAQKPVSAKAGGGSWTPPPPAPPPTPPPPPRG